MNKLKLVSIIIFSFFISPFIFATTHQEITTNVSIPDNRSYESYSQNGEGGVFYITEQGILNLGSNINFSTNSATQYGGAICNNGTLNIKDTGYYYNNSAQNAGAVLNYPTGTMNIGSNSYFENNHATGYQGCGGAIANAGTLTIFEGTKFISNTAVWDGGAISNNNMGGTTLIITKDSVLFSSNTAGYYGGAIRNNGSGKLYIGNNNIFQYNSVSGYGGAIHNNGYAAQAKIEIGKGTEFNSNTAAYGGAIANGYEKGNITIGLNVIFSSNSATQYGGAIYNNEGFINISSGTVFKYNSSVNTSGGAIFNFNGTMLINSNAEFNSNTASHGGGAIYNDASMTIGSNTKFYFNKTENVGGAAIRNNGNLILNDNVVFDSNIALSGSGGAIANEYERGNITIGSNVVFSSNYASQGGAIYNTGILTIENGALFKNNHSINSYGGAIYNSNILNLIANTNNVEFTGNTANGISNAIDDREGIINLWASDNASVIFNDRITSEDNTSVLNINQSSGTLPTTGKVILNEDMSGYTGQVNLYGGEIELQSKPNGNNVNTNKFFSGNINLQSGTLNILNNSIDNITVNNLATTSNANLKFDVNLSNNTSDNFTVTNSATGQINLTAINILGVSGTSGQITLFNSSKSPTLNILTTGNYGGYEYVFTNTNIPGVLNYQATGQTKTLKQIINDTTPSIRSYSLAGNEVVTEDLGNLGGTQLTIFGNNNNISGKLNLGISVSNGQTLNIENVNSWSGFNGTYGAIRNYGTLNVANTNFNNDNQDIINNGNLTLDGICYFEKGIDGTGTTTINGTITNNGTISQNKINMKNNSVLKLTKNSVLEIHNLIVDNATIEMANSVVREYVFNTISLKNKLNLSVDADLANKKMDMIYTNDNSQIEGKINIKSINILKDSKEETTKILFTNSPLLKDKVISSVNTVSKLYKYDVSYNEGFFNFVNSGINPIIVETAVASNVGGFVTQTNVIGQAFTSIDTQMLTRKYAKKKSVLYASTASHIFETENEIESGLWLRPYTVQETIKFSDMDVDNTALGTLAGLDLAVGDNSLVSFYLGYAGSTQKYEKIKIDQTGYILGATGMLIKDNLYAGLTANINFNKAESESDYGTDSFDMNMYSVGAKVGYNYEINDKWTLEPNLMLMYGNINNGSYDAHSTNSQTAKIDSQSISNIMIEPQIRAKIDLVNGWQPYGLLGYVANMSDNANVIADGTELKVDKIDGYIEYGAGVNKDFIDTHWSCYLQLTGRSGGRSGFAGNMGVKYKFGNKVTKDYSRYKVLNEPQKTTKEKLVEKEIEDLKMEDETEVEEGSIEEAILKQKAENDRLRKEIERLKQQQKQKEQLNKEMKLKQTEQDKIDQEIKKQKEEKKKLEEEIQKRVEKEVREELEAEEKAKLEEENRLKKEEKKRQAMLKREKMKLQKEEKKRQKMLEIERKIQENYN